MCHVACYVEMYEGDPNKIKDLLPSIPILPSPSLSPAARKALVSLSVRALAEVQKFCRNSLTGGKTAGFKSDIHLKICIDMVCKKRGFQYFKFSTEPEPFQWF